MEKTIQTFRYLTKSFAAMTVIEFLVILGTTAVMDLVWYLTDRYNSIHLVRPLTAPFELTSAVFALLIGLLLFTINFKAALANGISRKTFLLANLLAAALVAAVFSIFNMIVVLVHGLFWPVFLSFEVIYPNAGWTGSLALQFSIYFLLLVTGWFVTLAYYRSNLAAKWAISLAPFGLFGLLVEASHLAGGAVFMAIWEYLQLNFGDPYRAAASLLVYAAILYGLVYLLIRRAPLKE